MTRKANASLVLATAIGAGLAALGLAAGVLYLFFGVATTIGCAEYIEGAAPAGDGCSTKTEVWVPSEPHWIVVNRG